MKLLEETPAALSIGLLCEEDEYSFYWQNRSGKPVLVHNNGVDKIEWDVDHYVPSVEEGLRTGTALPGNIGDGGRGQGDDNRTPRREKSVSEHERKLGLETTNRFGPLTRDEAKEADPTVGASDQSSAPVEADRSDSNGRVADPAAGNEELMCQPCGQSRKERLMAEARSTKHLMTHTPKNPFCPICQKAKARQKQARRLRRAARKARRKHPKEITDEDKEPEKFGDLITADPIVLSSEKDQGTSESGPKRGAIVVKDAATQWMGCPPVADKTTGEAKAALRKFVGRARVKEFYSDNARELKKAAKELGWLHLLSTPYRHESNAVAERSIGVVKGGCEKLPSSCGHATKVVALSYEALLFFAKH